MLNVECFRRFPFKISLAPYRRSCLTFHNLEGFRGCLIDVEINIFDSQMLRKQDKVAVNGQESRW